jgi:hypothetical protein
MTRRRRIPLIVALVAVVGPVLMPPATSRANGDGQAGPPTVFERFVLSACAPCLRESFPVAVLPVTPLTLAGFPRAAAAAASRPGEIAIDVLRAQQPGRPDWRSLALRLTLSVVSGPSGETYRLGTGLLDGADARTLAQAVAQMAKSATSPAGAAGTTGDAGVDSVDEDFHGGTVRVGLLRLRSDAVVYVQTGDLPTLMQRAIWEVPTTLYLPVTDLPALAAALAQAVVTIERPRTP